MNSVSVFMTAVSGTLLAAWERSRQVLMRLVARDATSQEKLKQHQEALDAVEKAIHAKRGVESAPADRLRDNDGYRRD